MANSQKQKVVLETIHFYITFNITKNADFVWSKTQVIAENRRYDTGKLNSRVYIN